MSKTVVVKLGSSEEFWLKTHSPLGLHLSKEVRAYLRDTEMYSTSKTWCRICKLPRKRKVRWGRREERKKYSKESKKILTGKRCSSSDKRAEKRGGGGETEGKEAQKNVGIMEHCGPEQLQAKKRHVVAGRPVALCVRERLCAATMGRGGSYSTYHTVGWASTNWDSVQAKNECWFSIQGWQSG